MRENELGDLAADAYRATGQSQIGFLNSGSVRNGLTAGELTYRSILNILPYSNDIVTISISLSQPATDENLLDTNSSSDIEVLKSPISGLNSLYSPS